MLELLHKVLLERWSDAARVTLTRRCLSLVPSRYGERAQAKSSRVLRGQESMRYPIQSEHGARVSPIMRVVGI